ncbi:MAG TPA: nitrate reductase [Labilithrix sp.]|nr:nitrate reductase [Labilithrix sp.]
MKAAVADLVFQREGPLTRSLVRRFEPDAVTSMVCGFCSTGCSLDIQIKDGRAGRLVPSKDYSVNAGSACPKGWEALAPLSSPDRGTTPLVRTSRGMTAVGWEEALDVFVTRMKAIQAAHGDASVAFLGSGQMPSEELALLGALGKFGMKMSHGDGNTRQCMATAVVAYKQAFGFDSPPFTYADFAESDVLVFIGANPCIAHPIMWARVCENRHDPTVIVIDPRRTETASAAKMHLAIRPKSDLVLFYGLARLLIERGFIDRAFIDAHTSGFEAFAEHVAAFSLDRVCEATGLSAETIENFAEQIHRGKRVSFWWTMGVNQSHEGVKLAHAIIAIALMTGNIGRPGTGANSITGQCNAMGSRLFSNTTTLLGGHDFARADHRAKVANILGIDEHCIQPQSGLAYDQILEGILARKIRGLWIIATNTAHSWINQADVHDILSRLDFLVVQDMYPTTETARLAHLYLPAAGWGEKEGTFINSERRIGLVKRVARAPGLALADFYIFKLIAEAWGCGDMFREWSSPEAVFRILCKLTRGQPCDITGIDGYDDIERLRGIQWPHPEGGPAIAPCSERRLFEDGKFFHPDGRARFVSGEPRRVPEATCDKYPFVLLTGRASASQWHTLTRTGKSPVLEKLGAQSPYVEISPVDAAALGIAPGDLVSIESRRGRMTASAFVTHGVQSKQVFVPMHYAGTNQLTFASFDPESRQPAYKACAVTIRRADEVVV